MNIKESQNYSLIVEVLFLTQIEKRIDALVNRLINIPAYHRCSLSSCCCHPAAPDHLHGAEGRGQLKENAEKGGCFLCFSLDF